MKIVVDTNVVISGVFFKGKPRRILEVVVKSDIDAYASPDIVEEYIGVVERISKRGDGHFGSDTFFRFISDLHILDPHTDVTICRDPDDDKFIECAIDAKALYIVSGDKDLLDIGTYEGIKIITAAEFCDKYIEDK